MNIFPLTDFRRKPLYKAAVIITAVLVIAFCVVIFLYSAEPGNESDDTSGNVVSLIPVWITDYFARTLNSDQSDVFLFLDHLIRKAAHFTEYAILSLLVFHNLMLWLPKYRYVFSVIFTVVYAATDELHQLFVPGRAGRISDLIIDSAGAIVAILLTFFLSVIIRYHKNHHKTE